MLGDSGKKMLSARNVEWFLATLLTGRWFLSSHNKSAVLSDERGFDGNAGATSIYPEDGTGQSPQWQWVTTLGCTWWLQGDVAQPHTADEETLKMAELGSCP